MEYSIREKILTTTTEGELDNLNLQVLAKAKQELSVNPECVDTRGLSPIQQLFFAQKAAIRFDMLPEEPPVTNVVVMLKGGRIHELWADRPNVIIHKMDIGHTEKNVHYNTEIAEETREIRDVTDEIIQEYS